MLKLKNIIYFFEDLIVVPIIGYYLRKHAEDIKNAKWYLECFYLGTREYRVEDDPYLGGIYAKKGKKKSKK